MLYDITPFTTLDYPGELAAIFWFPGCNLACRYCHNPQIVRAKSGPISAADAGEFLRSRVGLLSAVVMSGGECSQSPALEGLCTLAKKLNFRVKIDSNASDPARLKALATSGLIDFCSLDFKAPKAKFAALCGADFYEEFWQSFAALQSLRVDFEVRTTVHSDYFSLADLEQMLALLRRAGYERTYAIQRYRHGANLGGIGPCGDDELFLKLKANPNFELR